ncbi:MAG: site-specific integrase [Prevotellaceae bacterium]|jgi:integrase|nr:site-specific integrase [Prevotellaceae bacterium]
MSNKKKQPKAKEPVKIRYKKLSNGNQSIYFDIYRNGKRMYEFPKLYLVPEKTPDDKEQNRQMLEKAIKIKAHRIDELTNDENGFTNTGLKQKANFIDWLQALAEKKAESGIRGVDDTYKGLIKHLTAYKGDKITFKHITKEYCSGFNEYLKTAKNGTYKGGISETYPSGLLAKATQYNYSRTLSVALNCAMQDGIIQNNPMKTLTRFERPQLPQSNREYLTIDEVKRLANTDCVKPIVKQAFLFSCFSGLRYSDVKALKWGDIQTDSEGKHLIKYTQQKTQKNEYLQLSDEALKFLPDKGTATDKDTIFILSNNGYTNQALKSWVLAAGVKKRVTFHVGRHTNATLLLSLGVPIETVSKLLGHSAIKTTQIYAKVIDRNKREAVNKLDGLTD